jgi:hypothetical protein
MFQTQTVEKIKTYFIFNKDFFFRKSFRYEIMWKKYCTAGQATDDNIIRRMRIACWIRTATNIKSEYVTLIASPLQQCLHERASTLC